MKKFLALVLACFMAMSLAACGSGTSGSATTTSSGTASAAKSTSIEPITLRLSTHLPADHGCVKMAQKFADLLSAKSNGAMTVEIYTDGQLGGQTENCEALISGTVDMTIVDTGTLANYEPEIGILDMPYVFSSKEQAITAVRGDVGNELKEAVTKTCGIYPASIQALMFRNTYMSGGKSFSSLSDFKGVKVRIPDNPSIEACFTALGATPVAIPSGEAYTAVQTGVANGLEGCFDYVLQQKFYEVADTCTLTEHVMTCVATCVSEKTYNSFTSEQKAIFDESMTEAEDYFYEIYANIEEDSKAQLEKLGVKMVTIDKQPLMDACAGTLSSFIETNDMQDIYNAINKLA